MLKCDKDGSQFSTKERHGIVYSKTKNGIVTNNTTPNMSCSLRSVRVDWFVFRILTAMERKELLIHNISSACFVIARKGVTIVKNLDVPGWKSKDVIFLDIYVI
ncbi:hypothetical protein TNCV_1615561 [Trichonephila clavipes]|nr:hypothetical protein TNCV_1615561 [Trichonephila clavipes]